MRSSFVAILLIGVLSLLALMVSAPPRAPAGPADRQEEPLAPLVRAAIDKGKAFLRQRQKQINGAWKVAGFGADVYPPGGTESLALLALLTCGVGPDDKDAVDAGLNYLRKINPQPKDDSWTYVVSLQTMVFALNGDPRDFDAIQSNANWLIGARLANGYWSYHYQGGVDGGVGNGDGSNTQYAVLALHEAIRAGAKVDKAAMKSIQDFYLDKQAKPAGTWSYRDSSSASMTMTTAGLCGLLISGMDLEEEHQDLQPDGSDPNCGLYRENVPTARALKWIGDNFPANPPTVTEAGAYFSGAGGQVPFYGLYGIERAGRLTGRRFLNGKNGGHDWYRVGCQCLVNSQKGDGSWSADTYDGQEIVATSFALLFLGKGRTPVLMTKLAYGQRDYEGWNNKHNDMRNVVEHASRDLFKKQPMAWQIFDIRDMGAENDKAIHDLTEQLLESPIVFFNGHEKVPEGNQVTLLKEYLENGGFLFAEACCNAKDHPDFDRKFRALMKEIFPDADLKPLDANHPIFSASGKRSDPSVFPLEGIERGCKTIVVYSPNAISGYWEANDSTSDKGRQAFELADNVIAYATGLEPPRQKLDAVKIVDTEKAPVKRGFLKTAQLKHDDGDWQPAPKAMHNLMVEARAAGLDVALDPDPIHPSNPAVVNYPFLYMHGRNAFSYKPSELEHLRFNLAEKGGLLFADACCGSSTFDASFRQFMNDLWANEKDKPKLEPIPPDDELFGQELNGKGRAVNFVMCRREKADGSGVDTDFKKVKPALEGVKINGRWVVIYSRYDIGCALEHHPTPGCLGHDYASAVALGRAAVLYALNR